MIRNKVALISGASSGIGYSTAIALAREGSKIVAGARRTERLEE
jgi:NADP-dependent 3-hydroxy acid dehydrogenase YdfG